ncbi:uncharacterized protein UV8b_05929 [Ustilaginoidea virens]|uniref:Carrier domain-containing protein n=1 Tax=Ustilaginoidea virens TaxID=1159556 RepID=A0A8E5HUC1_USTVR|nr:uncharacterized protein UV8b_05929 [Ustilaginoidea virens]QUC21686.1 hypothetical protein UV8b_05929 [Ustilaginoidea virens]
MPSDDMPSDDMPSDDMPSNDSRLLPVLVDEIAAADPTRPYVFQPVSRHPRDGWAPVTFGELANAINHVAHLIAATVKKDSPAAFPTLAYVGPFDVRYGIVVLAAVKAGCRALLLSPRNSLQAHLSLLQATDCHHVWYADSFQPTVEPWTRERAMAAWAVPSLREWLDAPPQRFPYQKSFEEARFDPIVVLHTSGSTGLPKPITVKQGSMALADKFRGLPSFRGGDFFMKKLADATTKLFSPFPPFHMGGLFSAVLPFPIYYGVPAALPPADRPITPDLVLECLEHAGADGAVLPPSLIEELAMMEHGREALEKLAALAFGGGNLAKTVGDNLVKHGVQLINGISSTEFMPYALFHQPDPTLWQYFIFNSQVMGAEWRPYDPANNLFELTVRRKDPNDPLDQPAFYAFPDLTVFSTGDLFRPHPTLKDHWIHQGRADNVIVFSNGEKLNPVTIEDGVSNHPQVKAALVVGHNRFQPALLLEPHTHPKSKEEADSFMENVWPVIEQLNKETVAHGRIPRELVALSDPDVPFPRAEKGTVQRVAAVRAYEQRIDDMYRKAEAAGAGNHQAMKLDTEEAVLESIVAMLDKIGARGLEPNTDFFTAGVDSLQVMNLSRALRVGFRAAGVAVDDAAVAPRAIYANPSPGQLARYLYALVHGDGASESEPSEAATWQQLVSTYTENLPLPRAGKPKPLDQGQTVILTGSTGSLGAYMLDVLCQLPHVKSVIALNRGQDGGESRQPHVSSERVLGTDFSKVEFLSSDLSKPDLGLGEARYKRLLDTADRIVHNAWPVNFKMNVRVFEPFVRGVRHLVDFSSAAVKQVPIIFVSSIGTTMNWNSASGKVPEVQLTDPALAQMGYGMSKLAASLILDAAAEQSGVPAASIRVGQVAGSRRAKGRWNLQEMIPSMIASSVHLGILPVNLGPLDVVEWMAVEDVAGIILDIAGITQGKEVSDISGYFNCTNPRAVKWPDLAVVVKDFYGGRIRELVSTEEWISTLEKSATDVSNIDKNPAIKLLDTYRGFAAGQKAGIESTRFETTRLESQSRTAANMGPVTPQLMQNWCSQWGY